MSIQASHAATEAGRLPYSGTDAQGDCILATHCPSCGFFNFPPSRVCAQCLSLEVVTQPLSREGVLYSYTTMRRGERVVFLGCVDLPEQIRLLALIEGFDDIDGGPTCGASVHLVRVMPMTEPNPGRDPAFVFRRTA